MKKRDHIIAAANNRFLKKTHKFGLRVSPSVKEALDIDKENGDTFWFDVIAKEMKNVKVAFKILDDDEVFSWLQLATVRNRYRVTLYSM